mgnify:CR=1 FL=1
MTTPSATAQSQPEAAVDAPVDRMSITISLNGPYLVNGGVPLTQEVITPVGGHREYRTARAFPHQETYALCRCGQTSTPRSATARTLPPASTARKPRRARRSRSAPTSTLAPG